MRKKARRKVTGGMRVRAYGVLARAVEEGVACGWRRAHKHTDAPGEEAIQEQIAQGVLNEICEVFAFDEEAEG
jgi:hypothetical protein